MRELRDFLARVIEAKRKLKEVYYTAHDADTKSDAKHLVTVTISVQKQVEHLTKLGRRVRTARQILDDRKAGLNLRKWSSGLLKRVDGYAKRSGKVRPEHLHKYHDALLKYVEEIGQELSEWLLDIETLREIPRPPRD